jgi:pyruvate/oxaloacetate carboxyltransferase
MHILFLIVLVPLKAAHFLLVLWRIDPLLGKDLERNNETIAVAMQGRGKHTPTTIKLLSETVFYTRSVQRGYKEDNRVEAGLNTSTVALRVVGGVEKGTQCLGV